MTIDAESDVIEAGSATIAALRDEVEARARIRVPLVWFVRFQRTWHDYVDNASPDHFTGPVGECYDGFALARRHLGELRARGDEIGWHYHAYNYVHRDDLSHATRLEILRADLTACAHELRRRHPDLAVRSFRFGWFFVPDYAIYEHLRGLGIDRDASIRPERGGRPVARFAARYLPPLVTVPTRMDGLTLFPYSHTVLIHDWQVIAHDFGWWSRREEREALEERRTFADGLADSAARLARDGGEFLTYETAPPALIEETAGG